MRPWNYLRLTIATAATALVLVATQAGASVAYDFTGLSGNQPGGTAWLFGNEFVVNSSVQVTAVGTFETSDGAWGAGVSVPVAIYAYDGGAWNVVSGTSKTFTSASSGNYHNGAQFQTLGSAITLDPGTYAIVGANYDSALLPVWSAFWGGPPYGSFDGGGAIVTGDSYHSGKNVFYDSAATLPSTLSGSLTYDYNSHTPGYGGATFEFTPVPEPVNCAMAVFGLGAAGTALGRRLIRKLVRP
jgi:hypothetical protein